VQAKAKVRQDILSWRVALLSDAGFAPEIAEQVAGSRSYDLHALLDLVDRGCSPELAVRILAPVDEGGSSRC
jgi:hypothetical protein